MKIAEIREDISNNCKRVKRKRILESIGTLTAICAKMDDEKRLVELPDVEIDQAMLMMDILRLNDSRLTSSLRGICRGYESSHLN